MKRLYIIGLLLSWLILPVVGQSLSFQSSWTGKDSVTLQFPLSVPDSLAQSNYSVCLTPYVYSSKGDTLTLEPVVFRGTRNQRYVERARYYGDAPAALGQELTFADTLYYKTTLHTATAPWLLDGRIKVDAWVEKEGCCNVIALPDQPIGHFAFIPPFEPRFVPVEDNTGKAGELQKSNPVLEHISKYRPYDSTRILRKEKGMLYVNFPVDETTLLPGFRNNAATLDKIVSITRAIMADTTSSVKLIQLIGLASIEGSVKRNTQLAEGRTLALKHYLQQQMSIPDHLFELCNGAEGWSELRDQINDTPFEGREELLEIIDNTENPNVRERKMKQLQGGKPYRFVKENILQDQRNSGYMRVYYDYVPDSNAKTINKASELLRQEKYNEALQLLQTVRADERSWNALGVALFMTGDQAQGVQYMRRAAAKGNADAQRNLQQYQAVERAKANAR